MAAVLVLLTHFSIENMAHLLLVLLVSNLLALKDVLLLLHLRILDSYLAPLYPTIGSHQRLVLVVV